MFKFVAEERLHIVEIEYIGSSAASGVGQKSESVRMNHSVLNALIY